LRHPYPYPYTPNVSSTLWLGRPLTMSLRLKAAKPYGKWDLPVARVGVSGTCLWLGLGLGLGLGLRLGIAVRVRVRVEVRVRVQELAWF